MLRTPQQLQKPQPAKPQPQQAPSPVQSEKHSWNVVTLIKVAIGVAIVLMVYSTFFTPCKGDTADKSGVIKSLGCSLAKAGDFLSKNIRSIYALIWTSVIATVLGGVIGIFRGRNKDESITEETNAEEEAEQKEEEEQEQEEQEKEEEEEEDGGDAMADE